MTYTLRDCQKIYSTKTHAWNMKQMANGKRTYARIHVHKMMGWLVIEIKIENWQCPINCNVNALMMIEFVYDMNIFTKLMPHASSIYRCSQQLFSLLSFHFNIFSLGWWNWLFIFYLLCVNYDILYLWLYANQYT